MLSSSSMMPTTVVGVDTTASVRQGRPPGLLRFIQHPWSRESACSASAPAAGPRSAGSKPWYRGPGAHAMTFGQVTNHRSRGGGRPGAVPAGRADDEAEASPGLPRPMACLDHRGRRPVRRRSGAASRRRARGQVAGRAQGSAASRPSSSASEKPIPAALSTATQFGSTTIAMRTPRARSLAISSKSSG